MNTSRKPLSVSLVILAVWLVVVVGIGLLQVGGQPTQLDELIKNQIAFGVLGAVIFLPLAITYLKWWAQVGWKGPDNLRDLRLLLPPALSLLILLLIVLFTGLPPARVFVIVVINTLMVGISEELMFRGVLFHGASSSFGTWRAVWITAILFGSVHILNGLITGDFRGSEVQALFAGMFGVWTAVLRVRLDTIIPVIIIHWLWNCLAFLAGPPGWVAFSLSTVLFVYGLLLLRKCRRRKVGLAEAADFD
ncbi:lysostaphin resistance A-like protein [Methanosarcina sp. T3]|uniref:CPBP family intramembrane glutamic endopeptidase n=1 Tax=Methanosarcina sp. T3 TaxID=3439062 RepID=UPI003F872D6A